MPNNLLHVEPHGFNLIPPETTQRLWVPREALTSVQVLGVIGVRAARDQTVQRTGRRTRSASSIPAKRLETNAIRDASGKPASKIFRAVDEMS